MKQRKEIRRSNALKERIAKRKPFQTATVIFLLTGRILNLSALYFMTCDGITLLPIHNDPNHRGHLGLILLVRFT